MRIRAFAAVVGACLALLTALAANCPTWAQGPYLFVYVTIEEPTEGQEFHIDGTVTDKTKSEVQGFTPEPNGILWDVQLSWCDYDEDVSSTWQQDWYYPVGPGFFGPLPFRPHPMVKQWTVSGPQTGEYTVNAQWYSSLRRHNSGYLLAEDDTLEHTGIVILQ